MPYKPFCFFSAVFCLLVSCTQENSTDNQATGTWVKPAAGSEIKLGSSLELQVQMPEGSKIDSIVYLIDTTKITAAKDLTPVSLQTDSLPLGSRLLTARIYSSGKAEEITTGFGLRPSAAPKKYGYQVIQSFPHDTSSYIQGLTYQGGVFYESDGGNSSETGYSSLRRVEPTTGKVLQQADMPQETFLEGLALVGEKIILLTWQEGKGMVYDKATFKKLSDFPYQNSTKGWGLCFDGKRLIKSDGSNYIYFLNKDSYREEGFVEVYDDKGPVDEINELEYIDGKIYANIYNSGRIVIIDPKNGQVTGEIDMTDLLPVMYRYPSTDVLNGIAWDAKGKRLFMTGKKWARLFQVKIVPL